MYIDINKIVDVICVFEKYKKQRGKRILINFRYCQSNHNYYSKNVYKVINYHNYRGVEQRRDKEPREKMTTRATTVTQRHRILIFAARMNEMARTFTGRDRVPKALEGDDGLCLPVMSKHPRALYHHSW